MLNGGTTASAMPKTKRRDNAIDITRGICIISMTTAHIAGGSTLNALTHALVWVDGSMGFVFLAGVVLGMVRRKTTEREGPRSTVIKTLKRTRLIYGAHVGITLLALVVGTGGVSAAAYGWQVLDRLSRRCA